MGEKFRKIKNLAKMKMCLAEIARNAVYSPKSEKLKQETQARSSSKKLKQEVQARSQVRCPNTSITTKA
ncbi:MAG: hypothetical protein MJ104_07575 [Lachnospiraceae bacterium]|nr:hypothetical protein [Lachnospiraceae bacterium]